MSRRNILTSMSALGAGGDAVQATPQTPSSNPAPESVSVAQIYPMLHDLLKASTAMATRMDKLTNRLDKEPSNEPVQKLATEKRKYAGVDPDGAG